MKKTTFSVCVLLVCVTLLTSCALPDMIDSLKKRPEPKSMTELWQLIETSMQTRGVYAADIDMKMTSVKEGHEAHTTATGRYAENRSALPTSYEFLLDTTVTTICEPLDVHETVHTKSVFADGKAYEYTESDGFERKIYSETSTEEYLEWRNCMELPKKFKFKNCEEYEFWQNEDGTWTAMHWAYAKEEREILIEALGGMLDYVGALPQDVWLVLYTDRDFFVTNAELTYVFEKNEPTGIEPTLVFDIRFTESEGVEIDRSELESYTHVDNVILLKQYAYMLMDIKHMPYDYPDPRTQYNYYLTQELLGADREFFYDERRGVVFGRMFYYYYDINWQTRTDKEHLKFDKTRLYYDGDYLTTMIGEKDIKNEVGQKVAQSEYEARVFIAKLVNDPIYGFDASRVVDVKKQEDNVWLLTQHVTHHEPYQAELEKFDLAYKSTEQTVTIRFFEGEIVEVTVVTVITGSLKDDPDKTATYTVTLRTANFSHIEAQ